MNMSFKSRFISINEETEQTITEKINKFDNDARESYKKAPGMGSTPAATMTTISPQQSILRSEEAGDDLNRSSAGNIKPNPTVDDADKMARTVSRANTLAVSNSSRTPAGAITEATDTTGVYTPGPYANSLTQRLRDVGINSGFQKEITDSGEAQNATGEKNITSGTKASLSLGRSDISRQAKDGLNTASNIPGAGDVKQATMESSVLIRINNLLMEYTNMDVKWGANSPGSRASNRTINVHGVEPVNHTTQTQSMVRNMGKAIETKADIREQNRKQTMPEPKQDHAATKTGGIHMQRSSIVHKADEANAQVRQEREQRMQQKDQKEQGQ